MALESGTYINSLVATNPVSTDGLSQADDHMRLIKSTIKNTFPNFTGALTSSHTKIDNGALPVGCIVLWSGSVASIPTGWNLCDGSNGTPDLTGVFVRHADADSGGSFAPGATGGSATDSITTSSDGAHTHTALAGGDHDHGGSSATHALTVDELPSHKHIAPRAQNGGDTIRAPYGQAGPLASLGEDETNWQEDGGNQAETNDVAVYTSAVGGGSAHSHNISSSGTHTHTTDDPGDHSHTATVDTVPPYYALAYIMRVAD